MGWRGMGGMYIYGGWVDIMDGGCIWLGEDREGRGVLHEPDAPPFSLSLLLRHCERCLSVCFRCLLCFLGIPAQFYQPIDQRTT